MPPGLWENDRTNGFATPGTFSSDGCDDFDVRSAEVPPGVPDLYYLSRSGHGHTCPTLGVTVAVMATSAGIPTGNENHLDHFSIGTTPVDVLAVDLNGDGILDLLTADTTQGLVKVLGGASGPSMWNETFVDQNAYSSGSNCASVAAGDISGDGVPDAVIACAGQVHLWVQATSSGKGTGAFNAAGVLNLGTQLNQVALYDMNSDGILDVVAVDAGSGAANAGTIVIALGQGGASFATPTTTAVNAIPGLACRRRCERRWHP